MSATSRKWIGMACQKVGIGTLLVAAMLGAVCGPAMADAADPGGRWTDPKTHLVLDISVCGRGWCGVRVGADGACGATSLRLTADAQIPGELAGRLDLRPAGQSYAVRADVRPAATGATLQLIGTVGDEFQGWRRIYPLSMVMVRSGDPVCSHPPLEGEGRSAKPIGVG